MILRDRVFFPGFHNHRVIELGLSLFVGLLLGLLVVLSPSLPVSSDFQKLILFIPFVFTLVILINSLERLILATIALGVPLNLDFSLIISPYAANPENIVRGYRTLVATTELRLSLVFVVLVVGYALWMMNASHINRRPIHFYPATTIPMLGLLFFSLLSITQAEDLQLAFFRMAVFVELFLAYFYLVNHINSRKDMQFFILVILGGMLAESLLMIIQWITGLTFFVAGFEASTSGPGRINGTLGNTGPAAGYLSALVVIAFAMTLGFTNKKYKVLAGTCMVFGTVALVSTGSRIGWFGFAVSMVLFGLLAMRLGWFSSKAIIISALLVVFLAAIFSGTIYTRLTADDNHSMDSRPMMWKLAWKIIQARPLLGVGVGNYALVTREYYTPDVGDPGQVFDKIVHNTYLGIWGESGTFAILCYLWLLGAAILRAWVCSYSRSRFTSLLGLGLALAITSLCIQMVTGTFHTRPILLFVWQMIALSASHFALFKEESHFRYRDLEGNIE